MEMKAILLAAGKGTRLRPLTDTIPKCLIPINGEPLLEIWLRLLKGYGVKEVLINMHCRAPQVEEFLSKDDSGLRIKAVYEDKLLGSAGTVLANKDFFAGEEAFFIIYADNLTDMDLTKMAQFHRSRNKEGLLTMGLHRTDNPGACGIAVLDDHGLITSFIEKPGNPESNLANAGVYVAGQGVFDYIPSGKELADFGFDVFPALVGRMYGYEIEEYLLDIGTPENYKRAESEWRLL